MWLGEPTVPAWPYLLTLDVKNQTKPMVFSCMIMYNYQVEYGIGLYQSLNILGIYITLSMLEATFIIC